VEDPFSYQGKRVAVTGCASGIGEATTELLVRAGAEVVGLDIRQPDASVTEFLEVDLSDPDAIDRATSRLEGPVDALFNCAGISGSSPALQVVKVDFLGMRHLTDSLVERMQPGSAIAGIASMAGVGYEEKLPTLLDFLDTPTFAAGAEWCTAHPEQFEQGGYAFSKQAMIVYTALRAVPLAARGIRINCIAPGVTETPMLVESRKVADVDGFPKPLGRTARPDEQAAVLVFLNSAAASYLTGQNIWVDGGYQAGRLVGTISR